MRRVLIFSAEAANKSTVFTGTTCLRLNQLSHETTRITARLEQRQRLPGRGSGMLGRRTSLRTTKISDYLINQLRFNLIKDDRKRAALNEVRIRAL